jgi:hypothetical protein
MKKIIYGCICGLALSACTSKDSSSNTEETTQDSTSQTSNGVYYAIDSATASQYMKSYKTLLKKMPETLPSSFTMNIGDLVSAVGYGKFKYVRISLGRDTVNNVFHVLLAGVSEKGTKLCSSEPTVGKTVYFKGEHIHGCPLKIIGIDSGPYALDFSSPCPPVCQN